MPKNTMQFLSSPFYVLLLSTVHIFAPASGGPTTPASELRTQLFPTDLLNFDPVFTTCFPQTEEYTHTVNREVCYQVILDLVREPGAQVERPYSSDYPFSPPFPLFSFTIHPLLPPALFPPPLLPHRHPPSSISPHALPPYHPAHNK